MPRKTYELETVVRLTADELRVLDAVQAHTHASSRLETIRQAIFARARELGLLVDPRYGSVLPTRMAARLGGGR